jgi:predicted GH43/DUF377 family glycosyl hydrolase
MNTTKTQTEEPEGIIQASDFQLKRYEKNPILSPLAGSEWESEVTTNPAAWHDETTQQVQLVYRAAGNDKEHLVHLGLAVSDDGYTFKRVSDKPILSPLENSIDNGCVEDPRIVKINDWYYITSASRPFPPGKYWENENHHADKNSHFPSEFPIAMRENFTSTHLYMTQDLANGKWLRAGRLTNPKLDDRDVMIFPEKIGDKWFTIHRPMQWHGEGFPNKYPGIWIAECDDLLEWKKMELLAKGAYAWEEKIGANNPPLKTEHGWLQIYHGVGADKQYRLGALLLDLENPRKVTHRTPKPIYEPIEKYETDGIYKGVCFPCGHAVIDGVYFLYYGAGDVHCAVCTTDLKELLAHLLENPVS